MDNKIQQRFNQIAIRLYDKEMTVLVAVSGGADSMLLLHLMLNLPNDYKPKILVAHVNHKLRLESEEEEAFVKEYCVRNAIKCCSTQWEDESRFLGTEKKARDFRYHFFFEVQEAEGVDSILTAHHGDDQAETLLMRMGKGTQLKSLSGIAPISVRDGMRLIRPLLNFSKDEIVEACLELNVPFFEDKSNATLDYQRNRIRHTVLAPYKSEFPNVVSNFSELSKQVGYANEILSLHTDNLIQRYLVQSGAGCQISLSSLQELSEAELYFLLVEIFKRFFISKGMTIQTKHVYSVMRLIFSEEPNKQISLPENWIVFRSYSEVMFQKKLKNPLSNKTYKIQLDETMQVSETEFFSLKKIERKKDFFETDSAIYIPSSIQPPYFIRRVVPGDRMIYNSKGQRKKVSRFFIDEKISREEREKSWIVHDSSGEIIWIASHRQSYLCNLKETDRILFELIYINKNDTV